jgi:hypothetical protein
VHAAAQARARDAVAEAALPLLTHVLDVAKVDQLAAHTPAFVLLHLPPAAKPAVHAIVGGAGRQLARFSQGKSQWARPRSMPGEHCVGEGLTSRYEEVRRYETGSVHVRPLQKLLQHDSWSFQPMMGAFRCTLLRAAQRGPSTW